MIYSKYSAERDESIELKLDMVYTLHIILFTYSPRTEAHIMLSGEITQQLDVS